MKISLRGMGSRRLIRKLEARGLHALVGGFHDQLFFDATWPSEELERFLRAAAQLGSFDLNPWMTFTRSEIACARFLRARPRKVIEESDADYENLRRELHELPWIGEHPKYRCRLPQRITLSRIDLKPNQVAALGQWTAEYVVGDAARRVFEQAASSGAEFRPILNRRSGAPIEGFSHLYTDRLLGARVIDVSSREIVSRRPEEQGYDLMGCFCYEPRTLEGALDFNRTGEANVGFEFPEWIVSGEVRDLFAANRLKGWAFEPVLEYGTSQYEAYLQLWSSLLALLSALRVLTVRGQAVPSR